MTFTGVNPTCERRRTKNPFDFRAMLAGLTVLKAIARVMTAARKRPHVMESPDNRHLKFAYGTDAGNTPIYPVQINDIGFEAISEFTQIGALQAQGDGFVFAPAQE
jgi:hypothetical protein